MDVRFVEILGTGGAPGKVAVSVDNGRFTFEILRVGSDDTAVVMGSGKDDGAESGPKAVSWTMAEMFGPGPYGKDVFGQMLPWLTPITIAHMIDNFHSDY